MIPGYSDIMKPIHTFKDLNVTFTLNIRVYFILNQNATSLSMRANINHTDF